MDFGHQITEKGKDVWMPARQGLWSSEVVEKPPLSQNLPENSFTGDLKPLLFLRLWSWSQS